MVARKQLRGLDRAAMDELVRRYQLAANQQAVAITACQLGEALGVGKSTATRRLNYLEAAGFITAVSEGVYEEKRKPSRCRLNILPYHGEEAEHEYALGAEWNSIRRRWPRRTQTVALRIPLDTVVDGVRGAVVSRLTQDWTAPVMRAYAACAGDARWRTAAAREADVDGRSH
jgi:DNA-binding transcriptional ArsR family regulator